MIFWASPITFRTVFKPRAAQDDGFLDVQLSSKCKGVLLCSTLHHLPHSHGSIYFLGLKILTYARHVDANCCSIKALWIIVASPFQLYNLVEMLILHWNDAKNIKHPYFSVLWVGLFCLTSLWWFWNEFPSVSLCLHVDFFPRVFPIVYLLLCWTST